MAAFKEIQVDLTGRRQVTIEVKFNFFRDLRSEDAPGVIIDAVEDVSFEMPEFDDDGSPLSEDDQDEIFEQVNRHAEDGDYGYEEPEYED